MKTEDIGCPEDVSENEFNHMMTLVPDGAEFVRSYIPQSENPLFKVWWRTFEFHLTKPIPNDWNEAKPHKVGDSIIFDCVLKIT